MNTIVPASASFHAAAQGTGVHLARSQNLDPGTYVVQQRGTGQGYGRSEGYASRRPYAPVAGAGYARFRVC